MPRRTHPRARSNLPAKRLYKPTFGARHPVVYDETVENFHADIEERFDEILPLRTEDLRSKPDGKLDIPRVPFRVYREPRAVSVTILERNLSQDYVDKRNIRWNANDIGRIRGEIENELGRLSLAGQSLKVNFTEAIRLGEVEHNGAAKVGVLTDQESPVTELLLAEHQVIFGGLGRNLKQFKYPWAAYVPHMTLVRIRSEVKVPERNAMVAAVNELLPIAVELEPIRFFAEQEV